MAKNIRENEQHRDAIVFLLLSAVLLLGLIVGECRKHDESEDEQAPTVNEQEESETVPDDVVYEAKRLANKEWEYISKDFAECGYIEYRLDSIEYVMTCCDVEGEIFEVYGITCSYRSPDCEEWEEPENADNSYFVFRSMADGSLKWLSDIRTSIKPNTKDFEDLLHQVLMETSKEYMFKLLADTSLEKAVEQSLQEYLHHLIPGDGYYFGWKELADKTSDGKGQAYGILLFHTLSGSPLIFSEETGRYCPAIYSTYLLPVRVSYQKDSKDRYVVTECWEPSEENYEEDIRECFPSDIMNLVFEDIEEYAADILEEHGATREENVFEFFSDGPVWPEYSFDETLDNTELCGLVDYYPEGDIYYQPIHDELFRRFYEDPVGVLNGLGQCDERIQITVCNLIVEASVQNETFPEKCDDFTDEGLNAYNKLVKLSVQGDTP